MNACRAAAGQGQHRVIIKHKPETIAIADHVVDLGPGRGAAGGEIVYEGTVTELAGADTSTGRHLHDRVRL